MFETKLAIEKQLFDSCEGMRAQGDKFKPPAI